ncbi:MAG TPA: hypothetical protein VG893_11450 [Terracidiphilus sp.]|nr:hypothetical protein [Terracidiphilus sp.]
MHEADSGQEWQRLRDVYRGKWDDELRALAADFDDLTPMAQQVLRDEMHLRGLDAASPREPRGEPQAGSVEGHPGEIGSIETGSEEMAEFTWKVKLCDCETAEQAWQIGEVLRRAGIESWVEGASARYEWDVVSPRVLVAADQLEQAQVLAGQPIPQDVIDQSKAELADSEPFELPVCPACGTEDPLLVNADPVNTWQCEACGREWSDPEEAKQPLLSGD